MICQKCKVEMVKGQAIESGAVDYRFCFFAVPRITYKTLKLIPCLKCPKCGYSDDAK